MPDPTLAERLYDLSVTLKLAGFQAVSNNFTCAADLFSKVEEDVKKLKEEMVGKITGKAVGVGEGE
jgi:hypothetical protein